MKRKKVLKITAIAIVSPILLFLIIITSLQLYSMYKTHKMEEISYETVSPNYWPTQEWQTSSPEEQGMDSAKLLEMVEDYQNKHSENEEIFIDSITIIRNGYIVSDLYFNPLFPKDTSHILNSCTKSIMATLIGIAIGEGYIENVDVPVLEILNDINIENIDDRLKAMTLKDLLTMETGLHSRDSYIYDWEGLFEMQATDDWTEHILNLSMETDPGIRYEYSNMASFLLSAIITKSTGKDTLSFAREYLFDPLEIKDIRWDKSPKGIYIGWARMWLKPHDMAKIGLLYLQKGKWEDRQVVPSWWVEESITAHSFPKQYRYVYDVDGKKDFGTSSGIWISTNLARPLSDGYGYQWWLDESGIYSAVGYGGQYITVVPNKNLIVVVTSKMKGEDDFFPVELLKNYIIPSIVSNEPIPSNEIAQNKLSSFSVPASLDVEIKPVQELSIIAKEISGKTYSLSDSVDSNPWLHDNFRLVFDEDKDYAEFSYTLKKDEVVSYHVGLDNVYRITETNKGKINEGTYAAIGEWTAPNIFTINYELFGYATKGRWKLTFNNNEIMVEETGITGVYSYGGKKINKD